MHPKGCFACHAAPLGPCSRYLQGPHMTSTLCGLYVKLRHSYKSRPPPHPHTHAHCPCLLQLMRDIAGVDEGPGSSSLVASLQQAGMLPLLLAMLKALSPIRSPQHPQKSVPGSSGAGASAAGQAVAELAPALAQRAQQLPSQPPYFGYRTDLLSGVLAEVAGLQSWA